MDWLAGEGELHKGADAQPKMGGGSGLPTILTSRPHSTKLLLSSTDGDQLVQNNSAHRQDSRDVISRYDSYWIGNAPSPRNSNSNSNSKKRTLSPILHIDENVDSYSMPYSLFLRAPCLLELHLIM
jgi:hypothetical protein